MLGFLLSIVGGVITGGFFLVLNRLREQTEFIAKLKQLHIECEFNGSHRSGGSAPFQTKFLEEILTVAPFQDQCPEIAKKSRTLLELAKDANMENPQTPQKVEDIQARMENIAKDISHALPNLSKRSQFLPYIMWLGSQKLKLGKA